MMKGSGKVSINWGKKELDPLYEAPKSSEETVVSYGNIGVFTEFSKEV